MKELIRVLGVDDGHFIRDDKRVPVFGVMMRGPVVEAAFFRYIEVDGLDATDAILSMLNTRHGRQVRLLFINGAAMGGTNVVDPSRLPVPFIAIVRKPPTDEFFDALRRSRWADIKIKIAKRYHWRKVETERGILWVASNMQNPVKYVSLYQLASVVPEPLRLAHICATAVTLGESRGRP